MKGKVSDGLEFLIKNTKIQMNNTMKKIGNVFRYLEKDSGHLITKRETKSIHKLKPYR